MHVASAFVNNNTRVAASHLREFVRQKHSDVVAVKTEHVRVCVCGQHAVLPRALGRECVSEWQWLGVCDSILLNVEHGVTTPCLCLCTPSPLMLLTLPRAVCPGRDDPGAQWRGH